MPFLEWVRSKTYNNNLALCKSIDAMKYLRNEWFWTHIITITVLLCTTQSTHCTHRVCELTHAYISKHSFIHIFGHAIVANSSECIYHKASWTEAITGFHEITCLIFLPFDFFRCLFFRFPFKLYIALVTNTEWLSAILIK